MLIAVLTQQVSHYHNARYLGAAPSFKRLTVLSTVNAADFDEFLSHDVSGLNTIRLFEGRDNYIAAVKRGEVWQAVYSALDQLKPNLVAVAGWSFPESLGAIAWAYAR